MWHVYLDRIMQLDPKYWWRWWRTPIGWVGNWTRSGMVHMRLLRSCEKEDTSGNLHRASCWKSSTMVVCSRSSYQVRAQPLHLCRPRPHQLVRPHPLQRTAFWKMLLWRWRWRDNCPLSPIAIVEEGKLLNKEHVHFATELLREQFPNARGLQHTTFGQNLPFQKTTPPPFVQILLNNVANIWIIGHRPHWKPNLLCMSRWPISENVEVNKADQYTESSCIKMLPDVGMVKVYPKCVLKAANVDRVVTLSRNTSLFLDFFNQFVFSCCYQ